MTVVLCMSINTSHMVLSTAIPLLVVHRRSPAAEAVCCAVLLQLLLLSLPLHSVPSAEVPLQLLLSLLLQVLLLCALAILGPAVRALCRFASSILASGLAG